MPWHETAPLTLGQTLAATAAETLSHLTKTTYTHTISIDDAAGVFNCDCSGYAEYLLSRVAPRHLVPIRDVATQRGAMRPLAKDFYAFFYALPEMVDEGDEGGGIGGIGDDDGGNGNGKGNGKGKGKGNGEVSQGWIKIRTLAAARRGDILVWRLSHSKDTGHVVLLAANPALVADAAAPGPCYGVRVYDSSEYLHFDDSRDGPDRFVKGLGQGTIHVDVDADGAPVGFRFSEGSNHHVQKSMVIARMVRFGGEQEGA